MPKSDHEQFIDAIAALKKIPLQARHSAEAAPISYNNNTGTRVSTEEYLSYKSAGIQTKIFAKLKKGQYRPLATIDLHGKTKQESSIAIHNFIANCQTDSIKYVMVIHGKGYNSGAILKNHIANLLKNNAEVLAFCSAKPEDGGTGAVYIILKRKNNEQ